MLTAVQQAALVAAKQMTDRNSDGQAGLHPVRDYFRLVCYPGTLASGFSARFYNRNGDYVDGLYIGIYIEPWAHKQPE